MGACERPRTIVSVPRVSTTHWLSAAGAGARERLLVRRPPSESQTFQGADRPMTPMPPGARAALGRANENMGEIQVAWQLLMTPALAGARRFGAPTARSSGLRRSGALKCNGPVPSGPVGLSAFLCRAFPRFLSLQRFLSLREWLGEITSRALSRGAPPERGGRHVAFVRHARKGTWPHFVTDRSRSRWRYTLSPPLRVCCRFERTSLSLATGRAWLGVAMEKAAEAGGVRVKHVLRGSPAEKAGLKEGDLIRAIDGEKVASPDDVSRIVGGHEPGEAIVASLLRAQDTLSMKIALASRPLPDEMLRMDRVGAFAPAWVGLEPIGDAPSSIAALRGKVVLLDFLGDLVWPVLGSSRRSSACSRRATGPRGSRRRRRHHRPLREGRASRSAPTCAIRSRSIFGQIHRASTTSRRF